MLFAMLKGNDEPSPHKYVELLREIVSCELVYNCIRCNLPALLLMQTRALRSFFAQEATLRRQFFMEQRVYATKPFIVGVRKQVGCSWWLGYTVRKKAGGSQSTKDKQKGGIHSAGASIRWFNQHFCE